MSQWIWFHVAVAVLLAFEYIVATRLGNIQRKAIFAITLWVAAALALAIIQRHLYGTGGALQFVSGYAIEEALSVDNLFVFLLLFQLFRVPEQRQPRVL